MKMRKLIYTCITTLAITLTGCSDFMDLEPKDKIPADVIFSDPTGVKLYMANLYSQLPIEDFNFTPQYGFNTTVVKNGVSNAMQSVVASGMYTDESCHSAWSIFIESSYYDWWEDGYKLNRDVNILIDAIPTLNIEEDDKKIMIGETAFIRAYTYFALARRYGGVCLIKNVQEYAGEVENLKIPRSTEKETWDFILEECDRAISNLPESWNETDRRATKWAALALKSRVALHAASIAKYWKDAPLSGDAVDQGLVGIDAAEANRYYEACIQAAGELMNSGKFSLYKPNPATPEEAAKNYQELFENPSLAATETLFIKGFGMIDNRPTSHNYDIWYTPNQTARSWPNPGRLNPTLDLIDAFECYDHPGQTLPIETTNDGTGDDTNGFNPNTEYKHFDTPDQIFQGRDARFFATINYPDAVWKGTKLVIQAGLIKPDGTALLETNASYTHNGVTYYTYGNKDATQYSGFDTNGARYTRTGFLMKKFLSEKVDVSPTWFKGTTDWIDMRYAEVLLDYAEAVVESGYMAGDAQNKATQALNDIRRRAGHTVAVPLTLENVLRERKIELAFENKRIWDLIRRRDYHKEFDNRHRLALLPVLDLRGNKPQYIFIRKKISREFNRTFVHKLYYKPIPGIATTGIVQNPQY